MIQTRTTSDGVRHGKGTKAAYVAWLNDSTINDIEKKKRLNTIFLTADEKKIYLNGELYGGGGSGTGEFDNELFNTYHLEESDLYEELDNVAKSLGFAGLSAVQTDSEMITVLLARLLPVNFKQWSLTAKWEDSLDTLMSKVYQPSKNAENKQTGYYGDEYTLDAEKLEEVVGTVVFTAYNPQARLNKYLETGHSVVVKGNGVSLSGGSLSSTSHSLSSDELIENSTKRVFKAEISIKDVFQKATNTSSTSIIGTYDNNGKVYGVTILGIFTQGKSTADMDANLPSPTSPLTLELTAQYTIPAGAFNPIPSVGVTWETTPSITNADGLTGTDVAIYEGESFLILVNPTFPKSFIQNTKVGDITYDATEDYNKDYYDGASIKLCPYHVTNNQDVEETALVTYNVGNSKLEDFKINTNNKFTYIPTLDALTGSYIYLKSFKSVLTSPQTNIKNLSPLFTNNTKTYTFTSNYNTISDWNYSLTIQRKINGTFTTITSSNTNFSTSGNTTTINIPKGFTLEFKARMDITNTNYKFDCLSTANVAKHKSKLVDFVSGSVVEIKSGTTKQWQSVASPSSANITTEALTAYDNALVYKSNYVISDSITTTNGVNNTSFFVSKISTSVRDVRNSAPALVEKTVLISYTKSPEVLYFIASKSATLISDSDTLALNGPNISKFKVASNNNAWCKIPTSSGGVYTLTITDASLEGYRVYVLTTNTASLQSKSASNESAQFSKDGLAIEGVAVNLPTNAFYNSLYGLNNAIVSGYKLYRFDKTLGENLLIKF